MAGGQVKSLSCFYVDHELETCRLLDWEIGRLCATEDAIDIRRGLPEQIDITDPIAQKPTLRGVISVRIDRRQPETLSERDDLDAVAGKKGLRDHNDAAARLRCQSKYPPAKPGALGL